MMERDFQGRIETVTISNPEEIAKTLTWCSHSRTDVILSGAGYHFPLHAKFGASTDIGIAFLYSDDIPATELEGCEVGVHFALNGSTHTFFSSISNVQADKDSRTESIIFVLLPDSIAMTQNPKTRRVLVPEETLISASISTAFGNGVCELVDLSLSGLSVEMRSEAKVPMAIGDHVEIEVDYLGKRKSTEVQVRWIRNCRFGLQFTFHDNVGDDSEEYFTWLFEKISSYWDDRLSSAA